MRTVGIIQPNYIPWRGYFDFIQEVDVFVYLDDVQYTRRDWRNRNRIRLPNGKALWLSVPVEGSRDQPINTVRIDNTQPWSRRHWEAIRHSYGKTPFFNEYGDALAEAYEPGRFDLLVELNAHLSQLVCGWLGVDTEIINASSLGVQGEKDHRLLAIVQQLDADHYLSGPAAVSYMRPDLWAEAGIQVSYKDYGGYPEYPQIAAEFEPSVSVLDLMFMVGDQAADYIWGKHREKIPSTQDAIAER